MGVVHKIGDRPFLSMELSGFEPPKTQWEVVSHPGVDGVGFMDTGSRPRPFTAMVTTDVEDAETADYLFKFLCDMINEDPVEIIYSGRDIGQASGLLFKVLDVAQIQSRRILGMVGGIRPPSTWLLICQFTLLAVASQTNETSGPEEEE